MTKYTTFRRFFIWLKNASVVHDDLKHEDVPGKKVFFETNVERITAFTADEISDTGYCVVIMYPDTEGTNQVSVMQNNFLVFIGFRSNTASNAGAIAEALDKSYAVWLDFIKKIELDEKENRLFLGTGALPNLRKATAQENFYEGYSGLLWQVNLAHQFNVCDLSKFADGGVTDLNIFE